MELVRETLNQLLTALECKDIHMIREARGAFIKAVRELWGDYQEGKISTQVRGQAIPRLMYLYVINDLPKETEDPDKWSCAVHELKNMRNVMNTLVQPKEK